MKYLIPVFVLVFLIYPIVVKAQYFSWTDAVYLTCGDLASGTYTLKLCTLLLIIQKILYAGALILAVIMVIIGGINYMTSAGDEEKAKKARKLITNAIIGFAIVIAFGFILGIVGEIISSAVY